MAPSIAAFICISGILGLFWLDRDAETHTSPALWLPVIWLGLNASRTASGWLSVLGFGPSGPVGQDSSALDKYIFLWFTLVGIAVLVRRRAIAKVLRANWPLVVFFAYCGLSVLWSDFPDITFRRWFKVVGDLTMVLIVLTDPDQRGAIKRVFARVGFVLLPLSILFIKYYSQLGRHFARMGGADNAGVADNKNTLGLITMIFGLGILWQFFRALRMRKTGSVIANGAMLAIIVWLFASANSATSMSCFFMAGCLIALTSLTKIGRTSAAVRVVALAMVSLSLFALFASAGGGMLGIVGREPTLTGRTFIWQLALGMQGNPFVGTGFETFWIGSRAQQVTKYFYFQLNEAHDGYLEIYLELGWIGVALLAGLIIKGYRNVLAAFRQDWELGGFKFAYFLAAVIYNLTESGFRILNPIWFVFLFTIISVPQPAIPEDIHPPTIGSMETSEETTPQWDDALALDR